jgi:fibronectin type 3 domain-containing protein
VTATAGNAQVVLSWTAPSSNGGSTITGYTATASPGGLTCSTAGLTCTVTGLTNGATYSFTVRARNAVGPGPASNALTAKPFTVPTAPQSLVASQNKTKGVNLAWSVPSTDGGSPVTGYRIYRRTFGTNTFGLVATVASVTSYRDQATKHGVAYTYYVIAVNAAGDSPASNEATAIAK